MNKHLRKFLLLLPCLLLHPEGSRAITVDIPAGEVVSGGDVHSVVTQRVYGEADNFTVSGKQQVMSGGVTRNSNIYPYGQQDVLQNGISYGTVVQQYAVQNVDGRAYSSSVGSYGTIDVNAGGYAEDTSVDGGSFFVSSGGTAAPLSVLRSAVAGSRLMPVERCRIQRFSAGERRKLPAKPWRQPYKTAVK